MRPIVAALAVALTCGVAHSQAVCAPRKAVEKNLAQKHGQALIAFWEEQGEGQEIQGWAEIWASPDREVTFIYRKAGEETSCIVGGGRNITFRAPKIGGDDT